METEKNKTKEEFIVFLELLRQDFKTNIEDWQNQDVESQLESIKAWIEDSDSNNFEGNVWSILTKVFLASKYYE